MKRRISFRSSKKVEDGAHPLSPAGRGAAGRWPAADRALASRGSWDWLAFPHQSRVWPEVLRAARPALVVGLVLLAVGITAAVVFRPVEREAAELAKDVREIAEAEIRLLDEAPSPNLNSDSAKASESEPAPRTELAPPSAPTMPLPRNDVASVEVPAAPPMPRELAACESARRELEPPRPLEAVILVPATAPMLESDDIEVRLPHLGDTPMIHEWKMLGLQTILAGALVAATTGTAPAEAPDKGSTDVKKDDVAEQLKALQGQMKAMTEAIQNMDAGIGKHIKKLEGDINRLSGDVLDSKLKSEKASKGVETLTADVERLRKELESLRTQVAAGRVSNYPLAQTSTGRVRIVNTFNTPITVLVNNKVYRDVMPGETRLTDALPAGTINYEVLGIQTARNTNLDPNEILTINVFTR